MGSEGYLISAVPGAAHQPPQRPMGRDAREPRALSRDGRARRSAPRSGEDFLIVYPPLACSISSRARSRWDETVWVAQRGRQGRRQYHQHRHRLARGEDADDRRRGAACRVRRARSRQLKRAVPHPGDGEQPHQLAGDRRATRSRQATPISSRWRGRCWRMPRSSRRPRRQAPTGSTSASPATRPASTTISRAR